jgi:PAS domain-containing protein
MAALSPRELQAGPVVGVEGLSAKLALAVIGALEQAVLVSDSVGRLVLVNAAARDLFGQGEELADGEGAVGGHWFGRTTRIRRCGSLMRSGTRGTEMSSCANRSACC